MKAICPKLGAFDIQDLTAVRHAFADAPEMKMHQAWLSALEKEFLPAKVQVGWREDRLLVFADLKSNGPFNQATKNNQRLWCLGDVFEIFLRDEEFENYVEFHISPNGLRLQLQFPSASTLQLLSNKEKTLEDLMVDSPVFNFFNWVEDANWFICASIPSSLFLPQGTELKVRKWRVSFSRYDYSSPEGTPVLSSTSPHVELSFHRQQEWAHIEFR